MGLNDSVSSLGSRDVKGFFTALEVASKLSWVDKLAMRMDSDSETENYKWLTATPALREWLGGRQAKRLLVNGLSITNKVFESTLEFLSEEIRRDKLGQIKVRIDDLADRVVMHNIGLLSTLILNGTGDTSGNCYDGQYFFDDDHEEGKSGVQKNLLAAGDVSQLNVGTATAPTALEAADAVLGVIAHMLTIKDDQAQYMNELARNFIVMTGPSLGPAFSGAVTRQTLDGNVTNPLAAQSEYKVSHFTNPRLSAWTTQFATFRADGALAPFILQEEVPVEIQVVGKGSEYEVLNRKQLFGVKTEGNVGFGLWQYASHSTLS